MPCLQFPIINFPLLECNENDSCRPQKFHLTNSLFATSARAHFSHPKALLPPPLESANPPRAHSEMFHVKHSFRPSSRSSLPPPRRKKIAPPSGRDFPCMADYLSAIY